MPHLTDFDRRQLERWCENAHRVAKRKRAGEPAREGRNAVTLEHGEGNRGEVRQLHSHLSRLTATGKRAIHGVVDAVE